MWSNLSLKKGRPQRSTLRGKLVEKVGKYSWIQVPKKEIMRRSDLKICWLCFWRQFEKQSVDLVGNVLVAQKFRSPRCDIRDLNGKWRRRLDSKSSGTMEFGFWTNREDSNSKIPLEWNVSWSQWLNSVVRDIKACAETGKAHLSFDGTPNKNSRPN